MIELGRHDTADANGPKGLQLPGPQGPHYSDVTSRRWWSSYTVERFMAGVGHLPIIGAAGRAAAGRLRRRRLARRAPDVMLNRRQVHALIDERARRYLGMSGDEFMAAAKRGELPDDPAVAQLLMLTGARSG
jgi:hypothetical protein